MKLIINADDYGSSCGINYGIIDASKKGVVTSTTMLVTTEAFEHGLELLENNKNLGVGIHLALTIGSPISKNLKTIVDENKNFYKLKELVKNCSNFSEEEIEEEYTAQIEKALKNGVNLTHIDSHHHVHMFMPMFKIATKLAKKYNLKMRTRNELKNNTYMDNIITTEKFEETFFDEGTTIENLKKIINDNINSESLEIMCHPAYLDYNIYTTSTYNINRIKELNILTSKEIKDFIISKKICLSNFKDL